MPDNFFTHPSFAPISVLVHYSAFNQRLLLSLDHPVTGISLKSFFTMDFEEVFAGSTPPSTPYSLEDEGPIYLGFSAVSSSFRVSKFHFAYATPHFDYSRLLYSQHAPVLFSHSSLYYIEVRDSCGIPLVRVGDDYEARITFSSSTYKETLYPFFLSSHAAKSQEISATRINRTRQSYSKKGIIPFEWNSPVDGLFNVTVCLKFNPRSSHTLPLRPLANMKKGDGDTTSSKPASFFSNLLNSFWNTDPIQNDVEENDKMEYQQDLHSPSYFWEKCSHVGRIYIRAI
jgi:hypothetical protein